MKKNVLLALLIVCAIFASACTKLDAQNEAEVPETEKATIAEAEKLIINEIEESDGAEAEEPTIEAVEGIPTVTGTTTFVVDIVNRLAEDFVITELIVPAGDDPHLYEPKPQDLEKLTNSDLVIYHGLHFEGRMVDVLETMGHQLAKDFPADEVGVMDDQGVMIVDPHFWFNIDLYKKAVENVADYLSQMLPDKAADINTNAETYKSDLDQMFASCQEKMDTIPKQSRILITPHDAFNYFSRSFDIPVMAPQGVSTDSEVANKDIQNTVDFIVQNKVKAVFAETTTDPARMEKLKEAAQVQGFEVKVVSGEGNELFSDSLAPAGEVGDNYIDMFTHNVDLIVENLK